MRILLVGTGSGGHVYPLTAVARSLRRKAQEKNITLELMLLGEAGYIERAAAENQISFRTIRAGKLRRYLSPQALVDIIKIPIGLIQSLWQVFWYMPDAIFSKGGYDAVAPVLAGWLYQIPIYTHESDSVPGLANRIIARMADGVFTSFEMTDSILAKYKPVRVGNPVRSDLFGKSREEGLKLFQFSSELKTLFVFGGSQGAEALNKFIMDSLVIFTEKIQIIHQCGSNNIKTVQADLDRLIKEGENNYADQLKNRYKVYPFLNVEEMACAYASADVILSRAGSGSLFEIAQAGKPAIIVPLPGSASDHQQKNALEFSKYGAAVIDQGNLTPHILLNKFDEFVAQADVYSQKIKAFAAPDAADKIAESILNR